MSNGVGGGPGAAGLEQFSEEEDDDDEQQDPDSLSLSLRQLPSSSSSSSGVDRIGGNFEGSVATGP